MFARIALVFAGWAGAFLHFAAEPQVHGTDHVVIVLDDSGSMNEGMKGTRTRRIDAAKKALGTVISQIPDGTNVGILLLNGARNQDHWLVPLGPLVKPVAIGRVNEISAGGGTPLGEAMRLAADELLRARSKSIYGTYRLIVVSDGEASDQKLLDQYLPDVLSRGLVVDAIGVDMRTEHSLATRVHSYRSAKDEVSLRNAIVEILAENSDQDSNASDADFELLNALNDVDAGAILQALATPNNEKVSGFPGRANVPRANVPGQSGGQSPGVIPTPANIPVQTTAPEPSFAAQLFGTFCTCMLPILIAIMIFITIASRSNRKRNR